MRRGSLASLLFLGCLLGGAPLSAASFSLTQGEIEEAIRFGKRSVVTEEFDREWKMATASGEALKVVTPFFRLAQAARNAAFKGEELKGGDIGTLLKEHQGKLIFWAFLHGGSEDFARWYQAILLVEGKPETKPTFFQNERTAFRQADGRFLARCIYSFPATDLGGKARVTLVVRDHEEREVAKFTVNLSTMR